MKIYSFNGHANVCGIHIKKAREQRGWSQEELAAKLQLENVSLSQKAISRIERQERVVSDYELLVLSHVLCVGVDWLLGEDQGIC